ncbi:MAG: hypothetical protein AAB359_07945, partial [Elusimicrobiota bacterium]
MLMERCTGVTLGVAAVLSSLFAGTACAGPALDALNGLGGQDSSVHGTYYHVGVSPQPADSRAVNLELREPSHAIPGCTLSLKGPVSSGVYGSCVGGSRVLLDQTPAISSPEDILKGNVNGAAGASMNENISCEFTAMTAEDWKTTGLSHKFRCYRINTDPSKSGKYFNSKGKLIPEAVSVGKSGAGNAGLLLNANGQPVMDSSGKPSKAEKLKVKYYLGNSRMREPFTETAANRLFWEMGITAD